MSNRNGPLDMRPAAALFLLALTAAGAALAALPPQYQRQEELERIIASPDVEAALASRPIDEVRAVDTDVYEVRAGECRLTVRIVDVPRPEGAEAMPGPRDFTLDVGTPVCR